MLRVSSTGAHLHFESSNLRLSRKIAAGLMIDWLTGSPQIPRFLIATIFYRENRKVFVVVGFLFPSACNRQFKSDISLFCVVRATLIIQQMKFATLVPYRRNIIAGFRFPSISSDRPSVKHTFTRLSRLWSDGTIQMQLPKFKDSVVYDQTYSANVNRTYSILQQIQLQQRLKTYRTQAHQ